jgi:hypothetical protein
VLEPGDERDVLDGRVVECREQVADHAAVDLDVLLLRRLARPGGEEDVGRIHRAECPAQVLG